MNRESAALQPAPSRRRQYLLAGVMLLMVAYFGGEKVWSALVQGPIDAARQRTSDLTKKIKTRNEAFAQAREIGGYLERWREQSLPADTELARSLYQAWLVELVGDVGFQSPSVNSNEPVRRGGVYYSLGFSVRSRGTIEQLTRFLFVFYETDLLHQIRSLTITPIGGGEVLDLSITIEAVSMIRGGSPGPSDDAAVFAAFQQQAARRTNRMASDSLADYRVITDRNLFGMGTDSDLTDLTFLTSVSVVDGQRQAWFTSQATGELRKLNQGDSLEVGPLQFTLVEVQGSDVVLETDGERWLLSLGESLNEAFALPPEH